MIDNIIETYNLSKIYNLKTKSNSIKALNNVSISVKKGEIFGLLGPNGAGKTSLIKILTTLNQPTNGYAIIDGYNILKKPNKVKSRIALMLGSDMLYYRITAYDNLKFFCKLYRVSNYQEKINDVVKLLGIESWLNEYVEKLSSGMKMKLALCRTILLEREILFLDEPTLGLDVKTVYQFIDIIKNINKTIILTSHDLSVVEKLCHRIAFINKGKILKIGTQEEVRKLTGFGIKIQILVENNSNELINELISMNFITNVIQKSKNNFIIELNKKENYKDLFNILRKYNILKFTEIENSLEDMFITLY